MLVYRVEPDSPVNALVNPEIEWSGEETEIVEEGCLSLPAVHVDVERPVHVRVQARDEHGEDIVVEASGLEARVIQHEIDHLDGVLILDRTTSDQRKAAMRALARPSAAGLIYLGTSAFAAGGAEPPGSRRPPPELVVTRPDRPQGPRPQAAVRRPSPTTARELGIEVFQPEDVNATELAGRTTSCCAPTARSSGSRC